MEKLNTPQQAAGHQTCNAAAIAYALADYSNISDGLLAFKMRKQGVFLLL